jgi:hypothetical protein
VNGPTRAPRRGRIPRSENEAPPPWIGLSFALLGFGLIFSGVAGMPGMAEGGGLVLVPFGLLFGSIGVALTLTAIRSERSRLPTHARDEGRPRQALDAAGAGGPPRALDAAGQPGSVEVFTRSPMRILVDLALAPLGGIGFLAFAILLLGTGPMGWIGSAVFAFFGILVLRGAAITMRRGWRRAVAEVGPDGIWMLELPRRLRWDEIDRLEVERSRGSAGSAGTAEYRRLGVWPRDRELAARAPGRGEVGMVRAFAAVVNRMAPGAGISDPAAMAPYGISAYEIEQDFPELLRSVGRYARIVGVDVFPGSVETVAGRPVPPAQLPDGVLGAILDNVAGAAGAAAAPGSLVAVAPAEAAGAYAVEPAAPAQAAGVYAVDPAAPAEASGSRSFRRRLGAGSVAGLIRDSSWAPFMIVVPLMVVVPQLLAGPAMLTIPLLWAFDLVALGFIGFGIGSLLELPGRWRMARGDPALVTVDEQGMEMLGMGRLAWSQIAGARVTASSIPTPEGRPGIRRLEIVPLDPTRLAERPWPDRAHDRFRAFTARLVPFGSRPRPAGAFALDLDLVEDPEGLLDAIARYRLVDES